MAPAITTPVLVVIAICVGMLVTFRECSSFSISQNTDVSRSGFLRSPISFATINQFDENDVATSFVDDVGVVDLFPVSLFEAADLATKPKSAETGAGAHDAFRFEWGRWIVDEAVTDLMEEMNEVKILRGDKVYDRLLELPRTTSPSHEFDDDKIDEQKSNEGRRFRISGGDNWDCILHILPKEMEWRGRWPTGSWAIVRTLTGMAEMALVRGPNRDGFYKKATATKLRGGGDGTLGGGAGGRGEDCVKYVGGALRSYSGVGGKTMLLEVVIRPP